MVMVTFPLAAAILGQRSPAPQVNLTLPTICVAISRQRGPSALVIEGEAGIGKTTLWWAAVQQARERGFRVLSARASQVESVLAYAVVADLISDVDCAALDGLPEVQRIALDRVLLRADGRGPPSDHRVVATALLSILERLAAKSPVLVAIDDVQWVDASSKSVVAFVARRLDRQIGVLVGEGPGPDDGETTASWLRLATQDGIERIRLGPLSLGDRDTFRLLLGFVEERAGKCPAALDIEDLNAPRISAFLDHLERSRGNTVRTRNARLAAIHSLFRFAYLQ